MIEATEQQWEETVALYRAWNAEPTAERQADYEAALFRYGILDSEIVDECYWD